jgi:hypothetical protein
MIIDIAGRREKYYSYTRITTDNQNLATKKRRAPEAPFGRQALQRLLALDEELEFLIVFCRGQEFVTGLLGECLEILDGTRVGREDAVLCRNSWRFLVGDKG